MKGYTSRIEIQNYLLITIDASQQAQVDAWITGMEAYVDRMTGRNFIADAVASEKKYDGDNTGVLLIDDCVEVSEITIDDGDPLDTDDYYLYPANELPKRKIKYPGGTFPRGYQNISVTAKWGYSVTVPEDRIKQNCMLCNEEIR